MARAESKAEASRLDYARKEINRDGCAFLVQIFWASKISGAARRGRH
jgi:hypothetical protein